MSTHTHTHGHGGRIWWIQKWNYLKSRICRHQSTCRNEREEKINSYHTLTKINISSTDSEYLTNDILLLLSTHNKFYPPQTRMSFPKKGRLSTLRACTVVFHSTPGGAPAGPAKSLEHNSNPHPPLIVKFVRTTALQESQIYTRNGSPRTTTPA